MRRSCARRWVDPHVPEANDIGTLTALRRLIDNKGGTLSASRHQADDVIDECCLVGRGPLRSWSSASMPSAVDAYRIDPERPVFLVGIRGPGRVRIVDREGNVVEDPRRERLEFTVDGKAPWDD